MSLNATSKGILQTLGVTFIILLALLILFLIKHFNGPQQIMVISAEGKIKALPDTAILTIGVVSEGANPVEVQNNNNQKMNQLINLIKQNNIPPAQITTSQFNASPKYNYVNGQNNIVGYTANQTITVQFDGIDKSRTALENVMANAVSKGANQIESLNFIFADNEKLHWKAEQVAIKNAIAKAKLLTSTAGLRLGKVLNLTEIDGAHPIRNAYPMTAMASGQASTVKPDIQAGEEEIRERINLSFAVH